MAVSRYKLVSINYMLAIHVEIVLSQRRSISKQNDALCPYDIYRHSSTCSGRIEVIAQPLIQRIHSSRNFYWLSAKQYGRWRFICTFIFSIMETLIYILV